MLVNKDDIFRADYDGRYEKKDVFINYGESDGISAVSVDTIEEISVDSVEEQDILLLKLHL